MADSCGWGARPPSGPLWNFCFAEWVTQQRVRTVSEERQWERRKARLMKLAEREVLRRREEIFNERNENFFLCDI